MAPTKGIIRAGYRGYRCNLVAQGTRQTIRHSTTERKTCKIHMMLVNTIVLLKIVEQVTRKLYVVGATCGTISPHARVPRWWVIDTLRENHDKILLIGFYTELCCIFHVLRHPAIAMVAY